METALSIANYFVKKSLEECVELTPMKLLKLVYISKGWYLSLSGGQELFQEDVEAWKYGPVIRTVYEKFSKYGRSNIQRLEGDMAYSGGRVLWEVPEVENIYISNFLDRIWEVYKGFNGLQLSEMTHKENTPWDIAYNKLGGKNKNNSPISNKLIKEHYDTLAI